jgi:hypothetical protein
MYSVFCKFFFHYNQEKYVKLQKKTNILLETTAPKNEVEYKQRLKSKRYFLSFLLLCFVCTPLAVYKWPIIVPSLMGFSLFCILIYVYISNLKSKKKD